MHYVYSTLSAPVIYTQDEKRDGQTPTICREVRINGGANMATGGHHGVTTPRGVVTRVNDEELAVLKANGVFKIHEANGFIVVDKGKHDPELAAATMAGADKSAPKTKKDYDVTTLEGDKTILKDKPARTVTPTIGSGKNKNK